MSITKKLTDKDWNSKGANEIATILSITLTFAFALTFAIAFISALTFVLNLALVLAIILLVFPPDSKPFLFPGAYLHYRKRMKDQVNIE